MGLIHQALAVLVGDAAEAQQAAELALRAMGVAEDPRAVEAVRGQVLIRMGMRARSTKAAMGVIMAWGAGAVTMEVEGAHGQIT